MEEVVIAAAAVAMEVLDLVEAVERMVVVVAVEMVMAAMPRPAIREYHSPSLWRRLLIYSFVALVS